MKVDTRVLPDRDALFRAAAQAFADAAQEAAGARGVFRVALSGGQTPRGAYALLAGDRELGAAVPWDRTHVFWGDERHVPPDHPDSNYRMAYETLLSRVPVPTANVHRIRAETPEAKDAAEDYEQTLRKQFRLYEAELPRFDLVLLGLGSDGHTASLFPDTSALLETKRLAVANWVEKLQADRITLTPPVFNNAACVTFLVSGEDKAPALQAVLEGPREPQRLPAQLIRPASGRLVFLVDTAAASRLRARS
jgi:6-phosphogluconolactonase